MMSAELSSQSDLFQLRESFWPEKNSAGGGSRAGASMGRKGCVSGSLRITSPWKESPDLLGLANRFEMAGKELLTASRQAAALRLRLDLGDYVL